MALARVKTRVNTRQAWTRDARARCATFACAVALCAAALACAVRAGRGAGDGAWETTGALARAMVNARLGAWDGDDAWTRRASWTLAAKVLACASAACAVVAVAPERTRREGAESDRARAREGEGVGDESRRETLAGDASPRTPEGRSPRGTRTLEDAAKAKEAAKERKRRLREVQEILAKKEEEERAEIARLVIEERARREAAREAATATELATRAARSEAQAKAEAEEEVRRANQNEREVQQNKVEEVGAETKPSAESKGSNSVKDGKKIPAPLTASKASHANGPLTLPRKQPAPPRSQGLTLRKIPAPRLSAAAVDAPAAPPLPHHGQPPPPPGPPPAQPPLPRGPPPDFARLEPPLPPMAPMDEVRRGVATFGVGVLAPGAGGVDAKPPPLSPRSSAPLAPPPGFESVDSTMARGSDSYDPWTVVDSTIQSFLASTTDVEDDPFTLAARHVGGGTAYEDIFAPQKSMSDRSNTAPPLPPTPHPEILANVFRDIE